MIGFFGRLVPAAVFFLMLVHPASAETTADAVMQWGLIGLWSLDCALPPDHNKGTVLSYEIGDGDNVVHRRDFGDSHDESQVLSATVSVDGILNLRVYFPSVKQTREYGIVHLADGSMRVVYNRNDRNQYTIRDGKFTGNGKPTPAQHSCERPPE